MFITRTRLFFFAFLKNPAGEPDLPKKLRFSAPTDLTVKSRPKSGGSGSATLHRNGLSIAVLEYYFQQSNAELVLGPVPVPILKYRIWKHSRYRYIITDFYPCVGKQMEYYNIVDIGA